MTTTNPFEPQGLLKSFPDLPGDLVLLFRVLPQHKFDLVFTNTVFLQSAEPFSQYEPGRELAEIFTKELSTLFREKMMQCIYGHHDINFQYSLHKYNQQHVWYAQVIPMINEWNAVKHITCICSNITMLEMAEKEVNNNKILLARLFGIFPMGMMVTDSNGFIIDCNAGAEKNTGLGREELLRLNITEQNNREFYNLDYTPVNVLNTPAVKALHKKTTIRNVIIGVRKKGIEGLRWLKISAAYIGLPAYGVVILIQNITQEIIEEEQIVTLENNLQTIINSSPDIVVFVDPELRISFVNKAAENEIVSLTGKAIIKGNSFIDYVPVEKREMALKNFAHAFTKEVHFTERVIIEGNREKWLLLNYKPVFSNEKNHIGYVITASDVTERKEEELRIKKQNSRLREIAKIQSHELRRPLTNIMAIVELLREEMEKEVDKTLLTQLKLSAGNLDEVIKKITARTNIT